MDSYDAFLSKPGFQELTVHSETSLPEQSQQSLSVPSNTPRLKVAIDFGITTSSICYDIVDQPKSLQEQPLAKNIVCDPMDRGSHRIPSVAFVYTEVTADGGKIPVLKLGETPSGEFADRDLAKIEVMKMALLPSYHETQRDPLTASMLQSVKSKHEDAIRKIQLMTTTSQMVTEDPLTGEMTPCAVNSIQELITLFFKFLWRLTMKHCCTTYHMAPEYMMRLFEHSVDVAVSAPAVAREDLGLFNGWEDSVLDAYRQLLDAAGYPTTTCILFEAKSTALFHIATDMQHSGTTIVVDIGGQTVDICDVGAASILCGSNHGVSIIDGSLKINEIFKEFLRTQSPAGLFEPWVNGEDDALEALAADFEFKKRVVNTNAQHCQVDASCSLKPIDHKAFSTNGQILVLKPGTMHEIFDHWLKKIFWQVDDEL